MPPFASGCFGLYGVTGSNSVHAQRVCLLQAAVQYSYDAFACSHLHDKAPYGYLQVWPLTLTGILLKAACGKFASGTKPALLDMQYSQTDVRACARRCARL